MICMLYYADCAVRCYAHAQLRPAVDQACSHGTLCNYTYSTALVGSVKRENEANQAGGVGFLFGGGGGG